MEDVSEYYEYGSFIRHLGLFYSCLIILFVFPLPIYSEIIYGTAMRETYIYIIEAAGLTALIYYVYIDRQENKEIGNISTSAESISFQNKYKTIRFKWNDISRIINIRDGDKNSMAHWGFDEGIILIDNNDNKMVIYSHINNYKSLKNDIMYKVYGNK